MMTRIGVCVKFKTQNSNLNMKFVRGTLSGLDFRYRKTIQWNSELFVLVFDLVFYRNYGARIRIVSMKVYVKIIFELFCRIASISIWPRSDSQFENLPLFYHKQLWAHFGSVSRRTAFRRKKETRPSPRPMFTSNKNKSRQRKTEQNRRTIRRGQKNKGKKGFRAQMEAEKGIQRRPLKAARPSGDFWPGPKIHVAFYQLHSTFRSFFYTIRFFLFRF